MSKYWSEAVRRIEPYLPGEQPKDKKYIKLNTNENPYPPSLRVLDAIRSAANENLRLYPDPECDELRKVIASYYGLKKENIFIGNGSDELLAFSFMAFFNPGEKILFPDITYTFYPVYCGLFGIEYLPVRLDDEFSIPVEMFFEQNGGIIIPNPNAPTGKYLPVESIKAILRHNPDSVVIIDEAYVDFGGESMVGHIEEYPNLLVIQTLSKARSLAGLRVGFAAGHEELIEGINRIKNSMNSYTVDRIALAGAIEAMKDEEYFQETRKMIIATRERITSELSKIGFQVVESKANFIFITHPHFQAAMLFRKLKENGVLVRYFDKPRINNYLRVSIGSDAEMDCFLEKLKQIMGTYTFCQPDSG